MNTKDCGKKKGRKKERKWIGKWEKWRKHTQKERREVKVKN